MVPQSVLMKMCLGNRQVGDCGAVKLCSASSSPAWQPVTVLHVNQNCSVSGTILPQFINEDLLRNNHFRQ